MSIKCGSIEENKKRNPRLLFGVLSNKMFLKAFADEVEESEESDEGQEDDTTEQKEQKDKSKNTKKSTSASDLLEKVRKEERDKQYKVIQRLESKIEVLNDQHTQDLIESKNLSKEIEKLKEEISLASKDDSTIVTKLKEDLDKAEKELVQLKDKSVDKEALRQEIREELEAEYEETYKVKTYRAEKLAEHKDDLLVPELVIGNTIEDIDASLASALERSKEIFDKASGTKATKNTKTTRTNPNNPDPSRTQRNMSYTTEQIANMDVTSKEYAEFRKSMGLR